MMELADGIGLKPRYFVTEVSIENVESWLRQCPCVANVHLKWKTEIMVENMRALIMWKCCATSVSNYFWFEMKRKLYNFSYQKFTWFHRNDNDSKMTMRESGKSQNLRAVIERGRVGRHLNWIMLEKCNEAFAINPKYYDIMSRFSHQFLLSLKRQIICYQISAFVGIFHVAAAENQ